MWVSGVFWSDVMKAAELLRLYKAGRRDFVGYLVSLIFDRGNLENQVSG